MPKHFLSLIQSVAKKHHIDLSPKQKPTLVESDLLNEDLLNPDAILQWVRSRPSNAMVLFYTPFEKPANDPSLAIWETIYQSPNRFVPIEIGHQEQSRSRLDGNILLSIKNASRTIKKLIPRFQSIHILSLLPMKNFFKISIDPQIIYEVFTMLSSLTEDINYPESLYEVFVTRLTAPSEDDEEARRYVDAIKELAKPLKLSTPLRVLPKGLKISKEELQILQDALQITHSDNIRVDEDDVITLRTLAEKLTRLM